MPTNLFPKEEFVKNHLLALAFVVAPVFSLAASDPGEAFTESSLLQGTKASQAEEQHEGHPGGMKGPCARVNLSDSQRTTLKEMIYQAKQKAIQTEADLKKAMMTLGHTLKDASSTREDGAAAQTAVNSALAAHLKIRQDLTLEVNYSVLQPNQREDAINCMLMVRAMRAKKIGQGAHQ